ncbi:MAG TPA: hypothetical protein VJW23_11225 [Propionibacteriaceae bacterium]|nr:hypothetical protein [Propionibacteriaceae bacterium]
MVRANRQRQRDLTAEADEGHMLQQQRSTFGVFLPRGFEPPGHEHRAAGHGEEVDDRRNGLADVHW